MRQASEWDADPADAASEDPDGQQTTQQDPVVAGRGPTLCIDLAGALGWLGTLLGLAMTQMPTKKRMMVASLSCSAAQVASHGW
jgi:hypothetical protein